MRAGFLMRAFVAPSVVLSIARRSKDLTHGFGLSYATTASIRRTPAVVDNRVSVATCGMTTASDGAVAASSATAWPLGLDPDNCKVIEIRQQIRRR